MNKKTQQNKGKGSNKRGKKPYPADHYIEEIKKIDPQSQTSVELMLMVGSSLRRACRHTNNMSLYKRISEKRNQPGFEDLNNFIEAKKSHIGNLALKKMYELVEMRDRESVYRTLKAKFPEEWGDKVDVTTKGDNVDTPKLKDVLEKVKRYEKNS